ncbi:MAG: hypothetical protein KIPDCIKN_00520 [Haliscomenobacter sp.]|nr:hypothetical protein [Haliscomenobacter sp.]
MLSLWVVFFLFALQATGQVTNNECSTATFLSNTSNWCSNPGALTTNGATLSSDPRAGCFPGTGNGPDVWFSFVAQATDLQISVKGAAGSAPGGTLRNPQLAVYSGTCGALTLVQCISDGLGANFVEAQAGGLELGKTYYIRVGARNGYSGTFQLCLNNFNLPPNPRADCPTSSVLCSKLPVTVEFVGGEGLDPHEIDGFCGRNGCSPSEEQTIWFKWTCGAAGTLTFDITPLNPSDDIDFILFELPGGLDDCPNKTPVRCMSSGENVGQPISNWASCTGSTGLRSNEVDEIEYCGCSTGDNNYLAPITMAAGKSYALVVINYSRSGRGFTLDFGGTGTFSGSFNGVDPSQALLASKWVDKPFFPDIPLADALVAYSYRLINSSNVPFSVDQITDSLPAAFSYQGMMPASEVTGAKSTAVPAIGATGDLNWTGGVNAPVTPYKEYYIGPGDSLDLVYQARIPAGTPKGIYTGEAQAFVGGCPTGLSSASVSIGILCPSIEGAISGSNGICVGGSNASLTVDGLSNMRLSGVGGLDYGIRFVYFNVPNPVNPYAPNGFLGNAVLNADATQAVLSNPNYPQTPGIYYVFAILNPSPSDGNCRPFAGPFEVRVQSEPLVSLSGGASICTGGGVTLNALVEGGVGNCGLQWQYLNTANGQWTLIPGVSGPIYSVSPQQTTQYRVVLNCEGSGCSQAISNTQTVTVSPDPSISLSGPSSVCAGGSAVITANLQGGSGACSILWQLSSNGVSWVNIANTLSSSISITPSGTYQYRAQYICSSSGCVGTSNVLTIAVVQAPEVTISGGGTTICTGGLVTLSSSVTGGAGTCSLIWQRSLNNGQSWNTMNGLTGASIQVAPTATTQYRAIYTCASGSCAADTSNIQTVTVTPDPSIQLSGGKTICAGGNAQLTANVVRGVGTCLVKWQFFNTNTNSWEDLPGVSGSRISVIPSKTTQYRAKYECTGSGCDVVFSNTQTVIVNPDPGITITGPSSLCIGGSGQLTATVSGGLGNCTIQWQYLSGNTWANLNGKTGTVLAISNLDATTQYRAVVTCDGESCGEGVSDPFTVTFTNSRAVTISGPTRICAGGSVTLTASGASAGCALQWYYYDLTRLSWVLIAGATGTTLQVSPTKSMDYMVAYDCPSGSCKNGTSNILRMVVSQTPAVTLSGPSSVCSGETARLSTQISNADNSCSFTWQSSTDGTTWSVIPNAASGALDVSAGASTRYRVIYGCPGNCGDTSNVFLLNVLPGASVQVSGGGTFCAGGSVTLFANTSGGAGVCSIQWQSSPNNQTWTSIPNAQSNSLTVSPTATTYYRALYTCTGATCNAGPSNVVSVQVLSDPTISISGEGVICAGGSMTLQATTGNGTGACTIQWQSSTNGVTWTNVSGANGASLIAAPLQTTQYRATYSCSGGGCNLAFSNVLTISVSPDPAISLSGPSSLCMGSQGVLTCTPTGGIGSCTIVWKSSSDGNSWQVIPGQSGLNLPIAPTATTFYQASLSCTGLDCGTAVSPAYKVTVSAGAEGRDHSKLIASCVPVDYDLQTNVNLFGNGMTTSFSWVAMANNPQLTGESTSPKTGKMINDVLTNTSSSPQMVVYKATAGSDNTCPGAVFYISVTVEPKVAISCLACASQINVSLDSSCRKAITPDMVLRVGGECPDLPTIYAALEVVVDDGNADHYLDGCGSFRYLVRLKPGFEDCFTFQPCEGIVVGQDFTGPQITQRTGRCGRAISANQPWTDTLLCTDPFLVYNNQSSWSSLNYAFYTGSVTFSDACKDACGCGVSTRVTDQLFYYDCNTLPADKIWARLVRTFTGTDCRGNTTQTIQTVYFRRPELDPDYYRKQGIRNIVLDSTVCTAPSTAEMVKRFKEKYYVFSHPYTCGNPQKYAYFPEAVQAGAAQFLMNCSYSFDVEILSEFNICSGGRKVEIAVKAFDECSGKTIPLDTFLLQVSDGRPPVIATAYKSVVISTGPENCEASFGIDLAGLERFFGIKVSDNCTANPVVSVVIWFYGPEYIQGFPIDPVAWRVANYPRTMVRGMDGKDYLTATGARTGKHKLVIEAFDECLNKTTKEFEFTIEDQIAPVLKCGDRVNVSLTDGQGYLGGYGKMTPSDIDKGSADNCGLKWVRIRRPYNPDCLSQFLAAGYDSNNDGKIDSKDGIDANSDGDLADFGEKFSVDAATGKLMTPLTDFVEFFCCDADDTIGVQLWAEDLSGNRNYCTTSVLVQDKTVPSWIVPNPVSVRCDNPALIETFTKAGSYLKGSPEYQMVVQALGGDLRITGGADCGTVDLKLNLEDRLECNAGYVDVYWTVTKNAGGKAVTLNTQPVRITVLPVHEYNLFFPADQVITQCGNMPDSSLALEALGCDALAVHVEDKAYSRVPGTPECYTIYRTFTVVNWCQYDEACGDPAQWAVVVPRDPGNDGFDGVHVLVRDRSPFDGIEEIYFDDNGNRTPDAFERVSNFTYNNQQNSACPQAENPQFAWVYTQLIRVADTEKPVIAAADSITFATNPETCTAEVSFTFSAGDNCASLIRLNSQLTDQGNVAMNAVWIVPDPLRFSMGTVLLQDFIPGAGVAYAGNNRWTITGAFPEGRHILKIQVSDGCGNLSEIKSVNLNVLDQTVVAPICLGSLSVNLMPIDTNGDNRPDKGAMVVLASSLIASPAFDCNGQGPLNEKGQRQILKFSINRDTVPEDMNASNLPLVCADAGGYVPVEVHAWDQSGNHSYCTSFLFVTDNQNACIPRIGFIEGQISTEQNHRVEDVEVLLSGGANQMMVTRVDGQYYFEGIDSGYDYSVYPSKNTDYANGVTTFDLVLIQQHILGQKLLSSPFKIIAADVNNSRSVTTLDMVQLRRVILNLESRFPSNRSWRFISAAHTFTDPNNPWNRTFPEVLNYNDLPDTIRHGNFIGVKVGDVSGNVAANSQMIRSRGQAGGSFAVSVPHAELPEGAVRRIPITASGWEGISGCQFTLDYDREALTLLDVEPGMAEEGAFAVFDDEGAITLSFVAPPDGVASDTSALITLVVQANHRVDVKQALRLSSRLTPSAAYDREGREFFMELAFEGETSQARTPELYQNVPNPFAEETVIRFALPEAQQAEISVYDLKGRLLWRKEGLFESGVNEILVRKSGLNGKGVLFYTLKTASFTATKKMLLLD